MLQDILSQSTGKNCSVSEQLILCFSTNNFSVLQHDAQIDRVNHILSVLSLSSVSSGKCSLTFHLLLSLVSPKPC